jgi:hypothetical protein
MSELQKHEVEKENLRELKNGTSTRIGPLSTAARTYLGRD